MSDETEIRENLEKILTIYSISEWYQYTKREKKLERILDKY